MSCSHGSTTACGILVLLSTLLLPAPAHLSAVDPGTPAFGAPGLLPPHEAPPTTPAVTPPARQTVAPLPPAALRRGAYQSVQVNVDAAGQNIVNDAANEPTIAVDLTDPARMVVCWRQFDTINSDFRQAGHAYSHNAGRSWTFPGVIDPGVFRSDPVLAADAEGNFYFYSLTNTDPYTCQMFKSTDGGITWTEPIPAYGGDKQWMAIDTTNGIGRGNIYAAWDYAGCCGDNWFTRSTDGGYTYMYPIPIPNRPYWGTVAVGPDGTVYVAGGAYNSSIFYCARSSNAQDPSVTPTFELSQQVSLGGTFRYYLSNSPNPAGLLGQIWCAVDHSNGPTHGYVYMLCSVDPPGSDPLDVKFIRSTDRGQTWSTPIRINDDPAGTNAWQWYGTMSVAPNGRIDVIWNDTRNSGGDYRWSEVYYSYSTDGGLTWSPNVPITPAFNSHLGWPQQNKLGDYYHMVSDHAGADLAYAATFNGEQDIYYLRIGIRDCNRNGVDDEADIAGGTSPDCNGDLVPDECQPGGTADCNGNGQPDLCDIFLGISTDTNHNRIPDECEGLRGDLNCDGFINAFDIDPFVLALTDPAGYAAAFPDCNRLQADINGDGQVNGFDIDPFVELLTGGRGFRMVPSLP